VSAPLAVGVPREVKADEHRVAITPDGVLEMSDHQVPVLIERGAGVDSGITDDDYRAVGATIVPSAQDAWHADLVLKVKEPQPSELDFLRDDLVLFTYLHLAAYPDLGRKLIDAGTTAIAYETVQLNGQLPLLAPMSEVAGRMAPQIGAHFLERRQGGRGVLLGGAPGVRPARVVVLGADLVIGAVLVPGGRAPVLVTDEMVSAMKPRAVIVDCAIDQGGSVEGIHETTHSDPVFERHQVLHYAVGNVPGAVPSTSTYALTNATLPYAVELATRGVTETVRSDPALAAGVNTMHGHVVNAAVAEALGVPVSPLHAPPSG